MRFHFSIAALALSTFFVAGCAPAPAPKAPAKTAEKKADHDHDHDHDHEHAHSHTGPHGGKMAVVGDEKYHLEWTHDDETGKVMLYVLDAEGKKEVPVGAEKLVVETSRGGTSETFELDALDRKDDKTARFVVVSKDLLGILEQLGKEITATVKEIEIGGEKFSGVKLEEHEHHH